jgi:DNA-binding response OmpR family regulator
MGERIKKILVVDDDEGLQHVISKRLKSAGLNYFGALTVEDGLAALRESQPDVVILDLGFNGMDGSDFLQTMRHYSNGNHPAVFVMSCFSDPEIVDYALGHGANDFMIKPYNPTEFIARLKKLLQMQEERN